MQGREYKETRIIEDFLCYHMIIRDLICPVSIMSLALDRNDLI